MTLLEMSAIYADNAARLKLRIQELRSAVISAQNDADAHALRRRATELEPLLREARELAFITAHYYDRKGAPHARFRL